MAGAKKVIGVTVTEAEAEEILRRSSKLSISKSKFTSLVVKDWLSSGRKLNIKEG